jgi:hypothetical protein
LKIIACNLWCRDVSRAMESGGVWWVDDERNGEWEGDGVGVRWMQIMEEWGECGLWEMQLWNGPRAVGWCVRVGWRIGRSGKGSDCDTVGRVTRAFGERGVHEKGSGKECMGRGETVIQWGGLREVLERGGCVGREVGRSVWEGEGL